MQNMELMNDVKNIVSIIIKNSSGVDISIENDYQLVNSGLMDSLSMVTLVQALIEKFNIDIDVSEILPFYRKMSSDVRALVHSNSE